ncbi:FliH/SctL family protein [Ideonella sp. BN130291]|uniref:FliH/SctL family protein n=1 Tax=Ideonella sp. BN130291 TaxID=3112940 RepID=UPI002E265DFD|nr:flagellar assembly protein FliH [Ideonella sp. BN130291]
MTSSSDRRSGPRQVPPPQGAAAKPTSAYSRFIPREELGAFASWTPDGFGGAARPHPGVSAPTPEPEAPTAEQIQGHLQQARQDGYQDGYRDGLVALDSFKQSFAQQMTAQIGQLLHSFENQLDELEQQMALAVARTATQLARQVVRSELQANPALVAKVAEEAVNAVLMSARHIRVHVNPQDQALVAEGAAEALQARGARLMASTAIERGGCLIESDAGSIDARIEARWSQAAATLGQDTPWHDAPAQEDRT